jgi:dihydroxyacetone kinase phosphoprotein-dependent L subunit
MIGDADFGVNVSSGFEKILNKLQNLTKPDMGLILRTAGEVFVFEIGSTIGGFMGRAFQAAGGQLRGKVSLNSTDFATMLETMLTTVQKVGDAKAGDKTLIDALEPAFNAARRAAGSCNTSVQYALEQAASAAEEGAQNTAQMVSKIGRASYIGERSRGSIDPGAMLIALLLRGISQTGS